MRRIKREIVGAILLSKDGKILLGKTAPKDMGVYSGSWVIPGGGIDEGETKEAAVIREVMEETHHDISKLHLELVEDSVSGESIKKLKDTDEIVIVEMSFIDFLVKFEKNADELGTTPTKELVDLRWFTVDELTEIDLPPPMAALFKKLGLLRNN